MRTEVDQQLRRPGCLRSLTRSSVEAPPCCARAPHCNRLYSHASDTQAVTNVPAELPVQPLQVSPQQQGERILDDLCMLLLYAHHKAREGAHQLVPQGRQRAHAAAQNRLRDLRNRGVMGAGACLDVNRAYLGPRRQEAQRSQAQGEARAPHACCARRAGRRGSQ